MGFNSAFKGLKQYLFFYGQPIVLFSSIMLNWSIEGNLPYVDETAGNDGESRRRINLPD